MARPGRMRFRDRGRIKAIISRTISSRRTVKELAPADKPWIATDGRHLGFEIHLHHSRTKAVIVNYGRRLASLSGLGRYV